MWVAWEQPTRILTVWAQGNAGQHQPGKPLQWGRWGREPDPLNQPSSVLYQASQGSG